MLASSTNTLAKIAEQQWWTMRPHPEQHRLWTSDARFRVVVGGRRTMKSTIAIRRGVLLSLAASHVGFWGVFAAPTFRQAKEIYWNRLKRMIPPIFVRRTSEVELTIELKNSARLTVLGMDRPERIEGAERLDFIVLDEFQEMKGKEVWSETVYPMLSDWRGEGWLQGKPKGKNHFFEFFTDAQLEEMDDWDAFHWTTGDVYKLYPDKRGIVEQAERDLDPLSFAQEFNASFVDPSGLAYYRFGDHNVADELPYDPENGLHLCFDFNHAPGVAAVAQEPRDERNEPIDTTHFISEVWKESDSTTEAICDLILDGCLDRKTRVRHRGYREHVGQVFIYGDATGSAPGSSRVRGSDWDLVNAKLKPVFGNRLVSRVPKGNPFERVRINTLNARLKSADGTVRVKVDKRCRHLIQDFGAVTCNEAGELEKKSKDGKPLEYTHISDAVGYYMHHRHPLGKVAARFEAYA